jgi:predicted anti-sigma-YlaC factor YlaD
LLFTCSDCCLGPNTGAHRASVIRVRVGVALGAAMLSYAVSWIVSVAIGLLALASYPQSDLAGVVLGAYVFVASTAMIAIFHFISPK